MKPRSTTFLVPLLLMVAVSVIMPGAADAAMWIGLQGGPNFVANGDIKTNSSPGIDRLKNVKTDTAFLGGLIIGYDFVNEGFLGYRWPNWLKYFSVAIDLTYNDFSQRAQSVSAQDVLRRTPGGLTTIHIDKANGYMLVLSLMVMAKYGFFPTPEIPFGRLVPYVGVGPGLVFSVVDTSFSYFAYHSSDSVEPGIFTEAGVRYMVRHNVSLDAAFRYRYVYPSYDRNYVSSIGLFYGVGRIVAQSFDAIFRVNYHF